MGQALYRKYRPRSFDDAVGQEAATKTLAEAIKSGRISHAYLFAGPRGVGKTSIARILAHQINELPYTDDDFHLDIIEIDAASNRRIDEIRDLREKVHIAPTSAKYKVYIIDEVHMLTKEAFNALLKTLEEPPAHCVFILATTEAHKLPETIISRTQRFDFKPINKSAAQSRLRKIAEQEKIDVDDEALALLAEFGEGSLRDVIGLLDQMAGPSRRVDEKSVRDFLGIPATKSIDELLAALENADAKKAIEVIDNFQAQASEPVAVAKAVGQRLRQKLIAGQIGGVWVTDLLKELIDVPASSEPQAVLELAILRAATRDSGHSGDKPSTTGRISSKTAYNKDSNSSSAKSKMDDGVEEKPINAQQPSDFKLDEWSNVLAKAKTEAPSLYSALRLARPRMENGALNLVFPFQLHQKKVQEAKQLKLTAKIIADITGSKPVIRCTLDRSLAEKSQPLPKLDKDTSSDLNAISNIFGAAEVLES
jgi:DNA polymerase-3 subunit gamma/tau